MIDSIWSWFAASPPRYWFVSAPFGLLALAAAFAPARGSKWQFIALLGVVCAVFRWPFIAYGYELNPDESQMLAGGLTLLKDPVFWRSVDAHAAGPLDVYPLAALGWLGAPLTYATARAFGYFADWISIAAVYFLIREVYGERIARVAALVPTAYLCLVRFWAVTHFSSESVPAALFGVGFAALWIGAVRGRASTIFFGTIVLGAIPWAKIQGVPIAGVGFLGGMAYVWDRTRGDPAGRRKQWLAAGAGLPVMTLFFVLFLLATGQLTECYNAYFKSTVGYLDAPEFPSARVLGFFFSWVQLGYWTFAVPLLGIAFLVMGAVLFRSTRSRILAATLAACTLAAFYCAVAPGRLFPHYLLLTVVPLSALGGTLLGAIQEEGTAGFIARRSWFPTASVAAYMLAGLLPVTGFTSCSDISPQYSFPPDTQRLKIYPEAEAIRKLAKKDDTMAIWGWEPHLYVQTGLSQATREAHTERQIKPGQMQAFYRARFLADLKQKPPAFFVDAVGPGRFIFDDRAHQGYECWPELFQFVTTHYRLAEEVEDYRIFRLAE